jgi:hypothetical protein
MDPVTRRVIRDIEFKSGQSVSLSIDFYVNSRAVRRGAYDREISERTERR